MNRNREYSPIAGFSLIEVLIAVVVLSFGILALTALQANLIKASTNARAQSVALALAKDQLEKMRGFRTMAEYLALTDSTSAQNIDNTNAGTGRFSGGLGGVTGTLGGTNFTRSWTVDRYAIPVNTTGFVKYTGSDTGALPAPNPAAGTGYLANSEYKTVTVTVTWTDAAGQQGVVKLEDAIAALDPMDSARNQRSIGGRSRGPKVIIFDPSTEAGVIPIAVGDGSETAATNPKPVVQARSGDDTIETRFDVLTYSTLSGGKAEAQAKVETTVVGCTCSNTASTEIGYRPTYWNGLRYVPPARASAVAPARAANGVTQSRYCDACCRDHHDPDGVVGAKFSPRRASHTHYSSVNPTTGIGVVAAPGGNYLEACRLIRVDGIFDVASDLSDDYMNLLDTASAGGTPAPSTTSVSGYQNFVLNYLDQRYRVPTSGTAATYNNRTSPNPATYAAAQNVDVPRPEQNFNSVNGLRWLHARGLYVDYLEPEAVDALNDAKTNCPGTGTNPPTTTQLRDCALRALPFTSINLTELAEWKPLSGTEIVVTNADFDTSPGFADPVRGKVTPGSSPTDGRVTDATARASASNSGIAISGDIDPDDFNGATTAAQPLRINGSSTGAPGGIFRFGTANYTINVSNPRVLGFTHPLGSGNTPCGVSGGTNPVNCTTHTGEPLPAISMVLRVGNYNTSGNDSVNGLTCTYPKGSGSDTSTAGQGQMPYKTVYDVTGFTSTNPATTFGAASVNNPNAVGGIPAGEYTEVTASLVAAGDEVTATFGSPTYLCPSNYPGSGQALTCDKATGNYVISNWSNTYVNCPSQVGPPNFP